MYSSPTYYELDKANLTFKKLNCRNEYLSNYNILNFVYISHIHLYFNPLSKVYTISLS